MTDYWVTLAGHRIRMYYLPDGERVLRLPALGGEDVTRGPLTIDLDEHGEIDGIGEGRVTPGGPLMGWGKLDCEQSMQVQPDGCAWSVSIPAELWNAARDYLSNP